MSTNVTDHFYAALDRFFEESTPDTTSEMYQEIQVSTVRVQTCRLQRRHRNARRRS